MADLGAIGGVYGFSTEAEPIGGSPNYGRFIPQAPFLYTPGAGGMWGNYDLNGVQTPVAKEIGGYVKENGVAVPNARVSLIFAADQGYGHPRESLLAVRIWQHTQFSEVVRTTKTNSDGRFSFFDIRKDIDHIYAVVAYNPNLASANAKAVGTYPVTDTTAIVLDFAAQNAAASGMFFLLT